MLSTLLSAGLSGIDGFLVNVECDAQERMSDFDIGMFDNYSTADDESIPNIEIIKDVINYLNDKLGTRYNYHTKNTQRHINARIAEGASLEDFKTVINKKYDEWHNDAKMKNYLRPETLFGTKFESYLNQSNMKSGYETKKGFDWSAFGKGTD